jgi:hypothetical protein
VGREGFEPPKPVAPVLQTGPSLQRRRLPRNRPQNQERKRTEGGRLERQCQWHRAAFKTACLPQAFTLPTDDTNPKRKAQDSNLTQRLTGRSV